MPGQSRNEFSKNYYISATYLLNSVKSVEIYLFLKVVGIYPALYVAKIRWGGKGGGSTERPTLSTLILLNLLIYNTIVSAGSALPVSSQNLNSGDRAEVALILALSPHLRILLPQGYDL